MLNTYAPIPKFDQYVEFVTQDKPTETKDGLYYDVVINPTSLEGCDLENVKVIEILVSALENVVSMKREVTQKDVDTLKVAIAAKGGVTQVAMIARLDKIDAAPTIKKVEEPLQDEPVIKLP